MTNKSGDLGTKAENAVVKVLASTGWPNAERRRLRGRYDPGDITGTPGLCWEVKGGHAAERASDGLIQEWLAETEVERQNISADYGILVTKRKGIGYNRAGEWWGIMPAWQFIGLNWDKAQHHVPKRVRDVPVRTNLTHLVTLLRISGYGDPL